MIPYHDRMPVLLTAGDIEGWLNGTLGADAEMASLNITRDAFHPEWNYKISPRNPNMKR